MKRAKEIIQARRRFNKGENGKVTSEREVEDTIVKYVFNHASQMVTGGDRSSLLRSTDAPFHVATINEFDEVSKPASDVRAVRTSKHSQCHTACMMFVHNGNELTIHVGYRVHQIFLR